ncbi:pre-mRNA-splicing factor SPF27-like [Artemia franciscana]|uniref:Pre-mRNA-splicing factor SPF27 n=1 Tax=Artemia franciscana TaxID=6661 RepID=A0AA88H541_ARTSF|nr:hypothetical protein QYM36_017170 [Artemia franciscana]
MPVPSLKGSSQPSSIFIDALPYIDQGYDEPGVREAAFKLIEEEMRTFRPSRNYLEHLPPLNLHSFETVLIKAEMERLQKNQPMDVLSMKRYELPPPPPGRASDLVAWTECVDNSFAQLEHQMLRITNLELMLENGCEAWKSHIKLLTTMANEEQKKLHDIRKQTQEINWDRKKSQLDAGEKFKQLETSWVGLVSKNYEIELVCNDLRNKIAQAKKSKGLQQ